MDNIPMRVLTIAVALTAILTGCGLFDSGRHWKSGPFEVIWIDQHSDSHLAYRLDASTSIPVVDSCVVAAGANAQYIAVKRLSPGAGVAYYMVERARYEASQEPREAIVGPLSPEEFEAMKRQVALPVLEPVIPETACVIDTPQSIHAEREAS